MHSQLNNKPVRKTLSLKEARHVAPTTTFVREEIRVRVKVRETVVAEIAPMAELPKKPKLTQQQLKDQKRAKAEASRERSLHKGQTGSILMRRGIMIPKISGRKPHEARA